MVESWLCKNVPGRSRLQISEKNPDTAIKFKFTMIMLGKVKSDASMPLFKQIGGILVAGDEEPL